MDWLTKTIIGSLITLLVAGIASHAVNTYKVSQTDAAVASLEEQAKGQARATRSIDHRSRSNSVEIEWANDKLDLLLESRGLPVPKRPAMPPSELAPELQ